MERRIQIAWILRAPSLAPLRVRVRRMTPLRLQAEKCRKFVRNCEAVLNVTLTATYSRTQ
jgi:hypothetical protein